MFDSLIENVIDRKGSHNLGINKAILVVWKQPYANNKFMKHTLHIGINGVFFFYSCMKWIAKKKNNPNNDRLFWNKTGHRCHKENELRVNPGPLHFYSQQERHSAIFNAICMSYATRFRTIVQLIVWFVGFDFSFNALSKSLLLV